MGMARSGTPCGHPADPRPRGDELALDGRQRAAVQANHRRAGDSEAAVRRHTEVAGAGFEDPVGISVLQGGEPSAIDFLQHQQTRILPAKEGAQYGSLAPPAGAGQEQRDGHEP